LNYHPNIINTLENKAFALINTRKVQKDNYMKYTKRIDKSKKKEGKGKWNYNSEVE